MRNLALALLLSLALALVSQQELTRSDGWESHAYTDEWATLGSEPPICFPVPLQPPKPVASRGQIGAGTSFGTALHAIASRPEVHRVLELGTFYGGGSTPDIASGLRDQPRAGATPNCVAQDVPNGARQKCCHSVVVTLEVFEPAWAHASKVGWIMSNTSIHV